MGALLRIFRLFWIPKISPLKSIHLKKILAKFSYPKKSQNKKFQTQKIPRQGPMHLWNPRLPKITCLISSFTVLWSVLCHRANCLGGGGDSQMKEAGDLLSWGWEATYIPSLNFKTCHIGEGSKIPRYFIFCFIAVAVSTHLVSFVAILICLSSTFQGHVPC